MDDDRMKAVGLLRPIVDEVLKFTLLEPVIGPRFILVPLQERKI